MLKKRRGIIKEKMAMVNSCDINKPYVFVSYSRCDADFVSSDIFALKAAGVNVWVDSEDIDKTSPSWEKAAEKAISDPNRCLFLYYLSIDSLLSNPCKKEIEFYNKSDNKNSIAVSVDGRRIFELYKEAGSKANSTDEILRINTIYFSFLTFNGAEKTIYRKESQDKRISEIVDYFKREYNKIEEKWVDLLNSFNPEISQLQIENRVKDSIVRLTDDGTSLCDYVEEKLTQFKKIIIECEKGSGKESFCAQLIKHFQDKKDNVFFFLQGYQSNDSYIFSQLSEQICFKTKKIDCLQYNDVMQQFENSVYHLTKTSNDNRSLLIVDYPEKHMGELFRRMMDRYYPDSLFIIVLVDKDSVNKLGNAFAMTLSGFSMNEIRLLSAHYNKSISPNGIAKIFESLNSAREVANFIQCYDDSSDFDSNWFAFSEAKEEKRVLDVRSHLNHLSEENTSARTFLELLAATTDNLKSIYELDEVLNTISPEHENCFNLTETTDKYFTVSVSIGGDLYVSFKDKETRDIVFRTTDRRKRVLYFRAYAEYYEKFFPEKVSAIESYYFKAADYDAVLRVMSRNKDSQEETSSFFASLLSQLSGGNEEYVTQDEIKRFFNHLNNRSLNEYVEPLLSSLEMYLMQSGDYYVAESVLNSLPQEELKNNTEYSFIRSVICHKNGKQDEAQRIIEDLIHKDLEDENRKVKILLRYADFLRESGKTFEADSTYCQILEICGKNDNAENCQAFLHATLFVNDRRYLEGDLAYSYKKNKEAEQKCLTNEDWDNLLFFYKHDIQIFSDLFQYKKCESIINEAFKYRDRIRNDAVLGEITILSSYCSKSPKSRLAFLEDATVKSLRFSNPIEFYKKYIASASAFRSLNNMEDSLKAIKDAINGFSDIHYKSGEGRAWNEKAITLFRMGEIDEALFSIRQSERLLTREKGRLTQVVFHYRNRILRKYIENPNERPSASDLSDLPTLFFVEGTTLAGFIDDFIGYINSGIVCV